MSEIIKKNDIVIAAGSTQTAAGITKIHHKLAKVIAVGKHDLFLLNEPKGHYDKAYRFPKSRCQKVDINHLKNTDELTAPKPGNLVFCLYADITKTNEHIGVLKEIVDIPGSEKIAKISHSTKIIAVPYKSLIILE